MGKLKRLSLYPAKRLEVLQEKVVLRKLKRELHSIVAASLWDPNDGLLKCYTIIHQNKHTHTPLFLSPVCYLGEKRRRDRRQPEFADPLR